MNILIQLGQLFRAVEEIEGRKKLQKMVHILQEFGIPFNVRYYFHYYGPFSEQLQDCVQSFQQDNLIEETRIHGTFETSRFKANSRLLDLLDTLSSEPPSWTSFAIELNNKSPRELEAISTVLFLQKQGHKDESLDQEFQRLKPQLKEFLPSAKATITKFQETYSPLNQNSI